MWGVFPPGGVFTLISFFPRVWGVSLKKRAFTLMSVFPTRVGCFQSPSLLRLRISLPTRVWGCFKGSSPLLRLFLPVFPRVGCFKLLMVRASDLEGLPHACGGVSIIELRVWNIFVFPACGGVSFQLRGHGGTTISLPRVGVFNQIIFDHWQSLPHACGGVSHR